MQIESLKRKIPYKWRVQSFSEYKPEATCVAYIDARDVMDLLDEVCGPENWQVRYEEHKWNLFASVWIKVDDEWVWKTDCGVESNTEREKWEASDAFKRACVHWGVGRFLYSLGIHRVKANEKKTKNPVNYPYVTDEAWKRVWDLSAHINKWQHNQSYFWKSNRNKLRDHIKNSGWSGDKAELEALIVSQGYKIDSAWQELVNELANELELI